MFSSQKFVRVKQNLGQIFVRFSSIFHLVRIRLHTENQLPRLLITALIVMIPGDVVVVVFYQL
jgi:hypothetical protein